MRLGPVQDALHPDRSHGCSFACPSIGGGTDLSCGLRAGSQPAHDGKRRRKWNTKTPTSTRWIFRRGAVWRRINWQCSFISDSSEEHTSELQSLMRNSYAVFCLKKTKIKRTT